MLLNVLRKEVKQINGVNSNDRTLQTRNSYRQKSS